MTLNPLSKPTPSTGRHISFEIQIGKKKKIKEGVYHKSTRLGQAAKLDL